MLSLWLACVLWKITVASLILRGEIAAGFGNCTTKLLLFLEQLLLYGTDTSTQPMQFHQLSFLPTSSNCQEALSFPDWGELNAQLWQQKNPQTSRCFDQHLFAMKADKER